MIVFFIVGLVLAAGLAVASAEEPARDWLDEAIAYGTGSIKMPLEDFYGPWTIFEEHAQRLTPLTERAVFFTPFLLTASEARDLTLAGQKAGKAECGRTAEDYRGYLVFSVAVLGRTADFTEKLAIHLVQSGHRVEAQSSAFQKACKVEATGPSAVYRAQGYVYFLAKEVQMKTPVYLTVSAEQMTQRRFYFNLGQMK